MKKYNLEQKIKKGTLSHAILLTGAKDFEEITSKIAKSFVCESDNKPCNTCVMCIKTDKRINPDIFVVDFQDKIISVSEIRKLKKDVFILPNECKSKVYIIKNAQNLNIPSQNALLKILEEPPLYAAFIIECENKNALLDTILSRVSIYEFNEQDSDFSSENIEKAEKILTGFIKNDELFAFDVKIKTKLEFFEILYAIKYFLRNAMVLDDENTINFELCEKINEKLDINTIFFINEICDEVLEFFEYNVSPNNLLFYFITKIYIGNEEKIG